MPNRKVARQPIASSQQNPATTQPVSENTPSLLTRRHTLLAMSAGSGAALLLGAPNRASAQKAKPDMPLHSAAAASNLGNDERVEFFTTAANLTPDRSAWILPIHARVYRPERSTVRKAALAKALQAAYGIEPSRDQLRYFDDRIDLLLGDNKGGRRLVITLAGRDYTLSDSGSDGHITSILTVKDADLTAYKKDGRIAFQARLAPRDPRVFDGAVLLVAPEGRSVISDIDDTVKITHVTDRKRMMEATFLRPFEAVPGIARLYQTWAAEGAAFHFVSSSPWHFYMPLTAFLTEAGFPEATLNLKQIRLKDSSIRNIFADATVTKPPEIEKLLEAWPARKFVLIGDSGEKDPEIYANVLRRHPEQIESIFIRAESRVRASDERMRQAFAGIEPSRWQLFVDPSELPRALGR